MSIVMALSILNIQRYYIENNVLFHRLFLYPCADFEYKGYKCMKKLYFTAITLAITLSSQVSANDENRHRLGVGYSTTDAEVMGLSFGYGDGIKLEYGYDANKYLSAHISYEKNDEGLLRGDTMKLGGDAGYTFYGENVSIKPFISGGIYLYEENFYDDSGIYFGF